MGFGACAMGCMRRCTHLLKLLLALGGVTTQGQNVLDAMLAHLQYKYIQSNVDWSNLSHQVYADTRGHGSVCQHAACMHEKPASSHA